LREEVPVVLEEGAVVSSLGDRLGAAQIDVDGVAVGLRYLTRLNQRCSLVSTELEFRKKKYQNLYSFFNCRGYEELNIVQRNYKLRNETVKYVL
jgi:hypothetical protein